MTYVLVLCCISLAVVLALILTVTPALAALANVYLYAGARGGLAAQVAVPAALLHEKMELVARVPDGIERSV